MAKERGLPGHLVAEESGTSRQMQRIDEMICTNLLINRQNVQRICSLSRSQPPQLELLFDSVERGVIYLDGNGILTFINAYAAELLEIRKHEVIGKRVDMLPLSTHIYKVLGEQCRDVPLEMAIGERIVMVRSKEVRTSDSSAPGEMTELWDITDAKRAKRQWEDFVSMMTHDLRSPLTVVMGYVQGIRAGMYGEVSDRVQKVVQEVEWSGNRLNAMIEDMLDSYRLEVGLLDLRLKYADIGEILRGCYEDNLNTARKNGVNLFLAPMMSFPELPVDEKLLSRVFSNLISNAIKYTPTDGSVQIAMQLSADALEISFSDTGIGIPSEDLARIFFKYYRSAGATRFKGTGLGLAISKTIMEAHGGSIEVDSTVGRGSRFTVKIPFCDVDEQFREAAHAAGREATARQQ